MDTQSFDFLILGGGPAGSALAFYASLHGYRSLLIEQNNSLGGLARSWKWANFIVDTGPHILHSPDSLITKHWKQYFGDLLVEGKYYSGNYLFNHNLIVDYPLSESNLKQLSEQYPGIAQCLQLKNTDYHKLSRASSFKDYVEALVGNSIAGSFFEKYPEKLWGIPTHQMLADWAPNRIRVTRHRESFFEHQFCAVARFGTGSIFDRIEQQLARHGSQILLNERILALDVSDETIRAVVTDKRKISICQETRVVSTLPVTVLAKWLKCDCDLAFRGVLSTYMTLPTSKKILPEDYSWLYFQDNYFTFNRITEPPSLSQYLVLDSKSPLKSYLIAEATFQVSAGKASECIDTLKVANEESLRKLPFLRNQDLLFEHNVEPYVYPIQDQSYKLQYKDLQRRFSAISNLSTLGASAEFHYSDLQVVFRKSYDFIEEWRKPSSRAVSRVRFESLRHQYCSSSSNHVTQERVNIIAEIGINHNGDITILDELIEKCSTNGADIIKLQFYDTDSRIGEHVHELNYNEKVQDTERNVADDLRTSQLTVDQLEYAFIKITELGLIPMASGFSLYDFKTLISIGYHYLKVASMDLNNVAVHKELSRLDSRFHVFISTGMSDQEEVETVAKMYDGSKCSVTFLHCTSSYPLPPDEVNLAVLRTYRDLLPESQALGYSDHTIGLDAAVASVHYGVSYIEKHVTLNPNMRGPDHYQSITPSQLMELRRSVDTHQLMIGSGRKQLQSSEYQAWAAQKKSLHLSSHLPDGSIVKLDDFYCSSPPSGLDPLTFAFREFIELVSEPRD